MAMAEAVARRKWFVQRDRSIGVEDLAQGGPPRPGRPVRDGLLHWLGVRPPLPCPGIGRHAGHVGREVISDVLEVGEERGVIPKDRVIADVAGVNGGQDLRPYRRMEALIVLNLVRLETDDLSEALHRGSSI